MEKKTIHFNIPADADEVSIMWEKDSVGFQCSTERLYEALIEAIRKSVKENPKNQLDE